MSIVLRPDHHDPIRPISSPEVIKTLARRLTTRDLHLMRLIWRHKVFTTDQLTTLGWGSYNTAKQRLATLYRLRALDRIRPARSYAGSPPWHYVLDTPGAEVLAAEDGITVRDMGYRHDRALAISNSALGHRLGVNQLFVDLYAHTRTTQARLTWWTERECADEWGDIVRPDGAGRWSTSDRSVAFFVEYDTGTERLHQLRRKLDAYAELAQLDVHGIALFSLPSRQREAHLRQALGAWPPVPVATAIHGDHPADAVWIRVNDPHLRPQYLTDLAGHGAHQPPLPWEEDERA